MDLLSFVVFLSLVLLQHYLPEGIKRSYRSPLHADMLAHTFAPLFKSYGKYCTQDTVYHTSPTSRKVGIYSSNGGSSGANYDSGQSVHCAHSLFESSEPTVAVYSDMGCSQAQGEMSSFISLFLQASLYRLVGYLGCLACLALIIVRSVRLALEYPPLCKSMLLVGADSAEHGMAMMAWPRSFTHHLSMGWLARSFNSQPAQECKMNEIKLSPLVAGISVSIFVPL